MSFFSDLLGPSEPLDPSSVPAEKKCFLRELSHRGTICCVYGSGKHVWTAGENNIREWTISTGENTRTWAASLSTSNGRITCMDLISGRLWCGRTDGAVSVFDMHTGDAIAHLDTIHPDPISLVTSTRFSVVATSSRGSVVELSLDGSVIKRFALVPQPCPYESTVQSMIDMAGREAWYCFGGAVHIVPQDGSPTTLQLPPPHETCTSIVQVGFPDRPSEVWAACSNHAGLSCMAVYNPLNGTCMDAVPLPQPASDITLAGSLLWCALADGNAALIHTRSRQLSLNFRLHQSPIAKISTPVGNVDTVFSASVSGNVRFWNATAANELCPLDELVATMVAAKPRGHTGSSKMNSDTAPPCPAQPEGMALEQGNSQALDKELTVKAADSLAQVPLESITQGTLLTPRGTAVSSGEVVKAMLQRLVDMQAGLEYKVEQARQCAVGVDLQAQLQAIRELVDSVSAKVEGVRVKQEGCEALHAQSQKTSAQLQLNQAQALERVAEPSAAPQQLPSAKAVETAVEQISKQNRELESQCKRSERQSDELRAQLEQVQAALENKEAEKQKETEVKIAGLEEGIASLRQDIALHSAGDSEVDASGLIEQMDSVKATNTQLETQLQAQLEQHKAIEEATSQQQAELAEWKTSASSQLEQVTNQVNEHHAQLEALSAPLGDLERLQQAEAEHAELMKQLEQKGEAGLALGAAQHQASESVEEALERLQTEQAALQAQFTEQLEEANSTLNKQQGQLEALEKLPEELQSVVTREELVAMHASLSKEQAAVESMQQANEQQQSVVEQVKKDAEGAADRAEDELQTMRNRCEEITRDAGSWRQLIEMRLRPLEDADRRFRPMLEEMLQ
eukprot:TRINITY_DN4217_c0_g1_i1.p1 TRINITY_DN4217_c0_g1~~TRINITY_DN4217_c0_g1_i1.p1  ORF type:complete len:854 (-),score=303.68 TRINITY_DN4217_c0_g1_i1:219-2780(-)